MVKAGGRTDSKSGLVGLGVATRSSVSLGFPRRSDREPTGWALSGIVGSIKLAVRKAQPLLGVILPGW